MAEVVGAAKALGEQLKSLQEKQEAKETELKALQNDSGMLYLLATKNRVDREGLNTKCDKRGRQSGQRDWIDGSGVKWCGDDSTNAYNRAARELDAWRTRISNLSTELNTIKAQVKEVNEKLIAYSNTNAGKQEIKDLGDIEKTKAQTEQIMVNAQAEVQRTQAKTQATNKKILWVTIILVSLISIGILIWWIRNRKKKQ